jgi:MFS family permease
LETNSISVGSIVCAVAKNSPTLIIGRAIAGAGAAGLYSGGMTMIAFAVPLRQRPLFIACLSSMFGIASIVGPILGGALTDSRLTWRWYVKLTHFLSTGTQQTQTDADIRLIGASGSIFPLEESQSLPSSSSSVIQNVSTQPSL